MPALPGPARLRTSLQCVTVVSRDIPDGCLKTSWALAASAKPGSPWLGRGGPAEKFAVFGEHADVSLGDEEQHSGAGVGSPDPDVAGPRVALPDEHRLATGTPTLSALSAHVNSQTSPTKCSCPAHAVVSTLRPSRCAVFVGSPTISSRRPPGCEPHDCQVRCRVAHIAFQFVPLIPQLLGRDNDRHFLSIVVRGRRRKRLLERKAGDVAPS